MNWWQITIAVLMIIFWILLILGGIFEWLALREQNEPKGKNFVDFPQYYRENPDKRPKD